MGDRPRPHLQRAPGLDPHWYDCTFEIMDETGRLVLAVLFAETVVENGV